jgi:hypothetical protein
MKLASSAALVLMLLAGCGGADRAGPADRTSSDARGDDREGVFDPLTDTIDRAESVQDTVDAQAEALRRQIEEAEGN